MDLEPYGWYSPAQIAARAAQRIQLGADRRGLSLPGVVLTAVREATRAGLQALLTLQQIDRRAAALLSPRR